MQPGERIKQFRARKGLTLKEMGLRLGYSYVYLSDIERGKVKPSREFLEKIKEVFNISSDYILYSGVGAQWDKIEQKLKSKGFTDEEIQELHPDFLAAVVLGGREEWERGHQYAETFQEPVVEYEVLPRRSKKLLDAVAEILESGDDKIIESLKTNVRLFLDAVRAKKEKGGT